MARLRRSANRKFRIRYCVVLRHSGNAAPHPAFRRRLPYRRSRDSRAQARLTHPGESMKLLAVLAVLALIATGLYIITPTTDAGPPTTTAPPAPKTRAQIANEAYAIEASVKAIAGRKTDPSNDGIGATTDYTFTSTADFDAGAKSASSGNYDVETLTDNLQISSGSLEMSNLKSDRFTLDDSDAVTRKWANDIGRFRSLFHRDGFLRSCISSGCKRGVR